MKISAKQYAQSFFSLVRKVNDKSKVNQLAANLAMALKDNFDFKKQVAIITELETLFNEADNKVVVTVSSAKKLADSDINNLATAVKKAGRYDSVEIKTKVDKGLIRGLKLQLGWQVVDATLKTQLNKLKESLVWLNPITLLKL